MKLAVSHNRISLVPKSMKGFSWPLLDWKDTNKEPWNGLRPHCTLFLHRYIYKVYYIFHYKTSFKFKCQWYAVPIYGFPHMGTPDCILDTKHLMLTWFFELSKFFESLAIQMKNLYECHIILTASLNTFKIELSSVYSECKIAQEDTKEKDRFFW